MKNPISSYEVKDEYLRVLPTVDIALLSIIEGELGILLIKRDREPFKDMWALPGGYVDKKDFNTFEAAKRELQEETNLSDIYLEAFNSYSDMYRDPREMIATKPIRIFSHAYYALIDHTKVNAIAGDDAKDAKWFKISQLPKILSFDHSRIINDAINRIKNKINYTNVGFELLPDTFTIPELQDVIETVIGEKLDRNNFRTKVLKLGILIPTNIKKKMQKGKPAPYYTLDKSKLEILQRKSLF
jgi:8-oxo-dGTP diphosphatase